MFHQTCKLFKYSILNLALLVVFASGCTGTSEVSLDSGTTFSPDLASNDDSKSPHEISENTQNCDSKALKDHELCRFVRIRSEGESLIQESFYNVRGKKVLVESFIKPNTDHPFQTYERVEEIVAKHWPNDNLEEAHHVSRIDHDENGTYDEIRYSYTQLDSDGKNIQEEHITLFQDLLQGKNQTKEVVYYQDLSGDGTKIQIGRVKTVQMPNNILDIVEDSKEVKQFRPDGQLKARVKSEKILTPNNGWIRYLVGHKNTFNAQGVLLQMEGFRIECNNVLDCSNGSTQVRKNKTVNQYDEKGFLRSTQRFLQDNPSAPWISKDECEMKIDSYGNILETTCVDPNAPSNSTTTTDTWLRAWEAAGLEGPLK